MAAPTTLSPAARTKRARKAAKIRWNGEARRDHQYRAIRDAIEQAVSAAPPLTLAQRERLALLLAPGGSGDAA